MTIVAVVQLTWKNELHTEERFSQDPGIYLAAAPPVHQQLASAQVWLDFGSYNLCCQTNLVAEFKGTLYR
jgi:hypothetical protein